MALLESAIGGIAVTVLETAFRAGGAVANQVKGAYNETQAKQKAIAAAQTYVNRYDERHCQVKVMPGLMKEPLPLEDIYTAVKLLDDESIQYFAAVDDLEATYRAKGRRSFGSSESPRQDGIQVANAEQYLMVLGGPGIGKSTFLRKIGLEALRKNGQIQRGCIPVLIELKELRDEKVDLKQKIAAEFATCGFPEAEAFTDASLAQGKLLVLLDGLDEVPTQNLNRVVEHIEKFVDAHSNNAFVASCRIAAYRGSHGTYFKRFTDVTLAEFDDEQIEQFIRRWFRSALDLESGTADKYWELLQKDENKATKELAQTPLLLTFLCLIYDRQQILPTQRSTLYGKALDILLSEWSAQKRLEHDPIYEGFHPDLEKVLLAQIAYESFEQDQLFFLKDDITRRIGEFLADTLDAPRNLDGAAVLRAIERQQGVLVERATDIYSFSHLTLQEYLTAFHIKEEGLEAELITHHLIDERWREVILLVTGMRGNQAINLLANIERKAQTYLINTPKIRSLIHWANVSTHNSSGDRRAIYNRAAAFSLAINSALECFIGHINYVDENEDLHPSLLYIDAESKNVALTKSANSINGILLISGNKIISVIAGNIMGSVNTVRRKKNQEIEITEDEIAKYIFEASSNSEILTEIFLSSGVQGLPEKLHELGKKLFSIGASAAEIESWAQELEDAWLGSIGLLKEEIVFDSTEIQALNNYLYVSELVFRCKDAAIRIPKQAWAELEDRLLTYPS